MPQGCPVGDTCPYNSVKLYLESQSNWFRSAATKLVKSTDEDVKKTLLESNYGKCVFHCDNDVVDHQIVNMLFEDDVTVSFTMNAFNKGGRFIHIMGTKGEIHAATDGKTPIRLYDFETKKEQTIDLVAGDGILNGHGGGDSGIVTTLYEYLTDSYTGKSVPDINESCYSHMLVFAAEESRLHNKVVDVDEYIKSLS